MLHEIQSLYKKSIISRYIYLILRLLYLIVCPTLLEASAAKISIFGHFDAFSPTFVASEKVQTSKSTLSGRSSLFDHLCPLEASCWRKTNKIVAA